MADRRRQPQRAAELKNVNDSDRAIKLRNLSPCVLIFRFSPEPDATCRVHFTWLDLGLEPMVRVWTAFGMWLHRAFSLCPIGKAPTSLSATKHLWR